MKIQIKSMEILMFLGIYDYEKLHETKVLIDLEIELQNYKLNQNNDLNTLLNYDTIINQLHSKFTGSNYDLIEDLIFAIYQEISYFSALIKNLTIKACKFNTHSYISCVCVEKEFNYFN